MNILFELLGGFDGVIRMGFVLLVMYFCAVNWSYLLMNAMSQSYGKGEINYWKVYLFKFEEKSK